MILVDYIPDLVGQVVAKVAVALAQPVYYEFGHYRVVENNLVQKDGAPSLKNQKYPLIWLIMDFEETVGQVYDELGLSMHLIIATGTEATYSMEQRRDLNFIPVLYPIYSALLRAFSESVTFSMPEELKMQHVKIDRPYWGIQSGQGNGEKNMFSDYIDAIEIRNLKLSVKRRYC